MFVSALFKTVFHLISNAKIMSILEITFGISFICNDIDLTDILSKTENSLSTAIYQSEVRQLEKNIRFTVRQFASTCLSVKTPQTTQITLNEHQNQPLQQQRPWRDCADAQASLSVWLLVVPNIMYMRKGVNIDN